MRKHHLLATAAIVTLSCGISAQATIFDRDVTTVSELRPAGEGFSAQLARQYRDFSLFESEQMYDWADADHFAEKAYAANSGAQPAPERPGEWNIGDPIAMNDLELARERLTAAFDKGARTIAPREAAVAQAKYDCWVEQQEEGWQYRHIAACRHDFDLAIKKLAAAMPPKEPAVQPTAARSEQPQVAKIEAPEPLKVPVTEMQQIYFDFDSAALNAAAERQIAAFADGIADKEAVEIVVTGHADRAGPADYNVELSARRAQTVRNELTRHGLNISELDDFDLRAEGETTPAVPTADGVREPANRRVVLFGVGYADQKQLSDLKN